LTWETPVTFLEKSNWVVLIVGVPTLLGYLAMIVPQVLGGPMTDVAWVQPMIVTMVAFVVANVLGNVVAAATNPGDAGKNDERDREIDRVGERVGNWLIVAGALVALVLAMAQVDHFWIANALLLGGIAGSLVSAVTKIAAYHKPFQAW
jgi:hypothetical protein